MEKLYPPEVKRFKQFNIDTYLSEVTEYIPPLTEEFDSQEAFKKIKTNPDRKKAIAEFKEKLNNQIEGMACCRTSIETMIAQNPNVDVKILFDILDKFASKYGVTGSQLEKYRRVIHRFFEQRLKVETIRKAYPRDIDLLNSMLEPKDKFLWVRGLKILDTPYGFAIYLNKKDAQKFSTEANEKGGFSEIKYFKIKKSNTNEETTIKSHVAFIILDSKFVTSKKISLEQITAHELEHNKTDLLFKDSDTTVSNWGTYSGKSGISELSELLVKGKENDSGLEEQELENLLLLEFHNYCLDFFYFLNRYISNEIISRKRDKANHDMKEVIKNYSDFEELDKFTDEICKNLSNRPEIQTKILNLKNKLKNKFYSNAELSNQYFDKLVSEGRYSTDEAIAFLTFTPLEVWPRKINYVLKKYT